MVEGVMNYTGSKYKLLEQILPEMDYTKIYFVDLFTGGGSIYTNIVDRFEKVIINDIIGDIIGIHKGLIESDKIIEDTKSICPSKDDAEAFRLLRDSYNNDPTSAKLWALMLSCTSNMMRFNKSFKFNQTFGKRTWNSSTDKKVELFTNHIRKYKDKVKFISKSFYYVPITSDKIMFYCDPPYSNTEAGYNAFWNKDDDDKLYDYLNKINESGSSFMISGSLIHNGIECKLLRRLIDDGFRYKELDFDYNKVSRIGKKDINEIIIMNY